MGAGQTLLCLWALNVCSVTQPSWPPHSYGHRQALCLPTPPRALSSPHMPALWSLCPGLGKRAGGTKAGQGFSPVTPMGPKGGGMMIQAWPLPMALTLFTQMQAPATPLPAWSLSKVLSPSSP